MNDAQPCLGHFERLLVDHISLKSSGNGRNVVFVPLLTDVVVVTDIIAKKGDSRALIL